MMMMKPGDKWEVVLPSELAYGNQYVSKLIEPGSVLIFDIEIFKVRFTYSIHLYL